jgi:hypothetical protein
MRGNVPYPEWAITETEEENENEEHAHDEENDGIK